MTRPDSDRERNAPAATQSREDYWAAERQDAYDLARGDGLLGNPWRRFTTFEREVRSWPLFGLCTLVVAAAYYLAGYQYWDFRDPQTGDLDWFLIAIYWAVCASVVWLCWPMPKSRRSGGDPG